MTLDRLFWSQWAGNAALDLGARLAEILIHDPPEDEDIREALQLMIRAEGLLAGRRESSTADPKAGPPVSCACSPSTGLCPIHSKKHAYHNVGADRCGECGEDYDHRNHRREQEMTEEAEPTFDAVIQVQDSSFISGVVYDHNTLVMDIQFARGSIYRYENVTPLEFTMLVTSRSTGRTFNAVIKNQKECTRLRRTSL